MATACARQQSHRNEQTKPVSTGARVKRVFAQHTPLRRQSMFLDLTHPFFWKSCTTVNPPTWQPGEPHSGIHFQKHPSELGVSGNTPATLLFSNSRERLHNSDRKWIPSPLPTNAMRKKESRDKTGRSSESSSGPYILIRTFCEIST